LNLKTQKHTNGFNYTEERISGIEDKVEKLLHSDSNKEKDDQPALVAHTYNPSYSRGRDQESHGSKPDQENSLRVPISKKSHHKKGLVE
jgi:hypothetical protein